MKSRTSSLDLHFLERELQRLVGCRLNKVYQDGKSFLFDFHEPGEGKTELRMIIPSFVFFTKYKPDFPDHPPKFCMFLRKHVAGSFVKRVEQHGFDRILEIEFERKEGNKTLVVELFSKGNVILCDEDYEIISPMQPQSWQARKIRGGAKYEYPPAQVNTKDSSVEKVKGILKGSDLDSLVKSFAVDFGLGGLYAEELCERSGLDADIKPYAADAEDVLDALNNLLAEELSPNSSGDEVFPIAMLTKEDDSSFDSFNEAIDEVISRNLVEQKREQKERQWKERVEKVEKVLKQQEKSIRKLEGDVKDNKRKGELLFEKYQMVSEILYQLKKDREELSWDEIKKKYSGHDVVKQVNEKEGLVVVDL